MSRAEGRLVGGRYQLMEPIGRGGMGVVWRAHDQLLDRAVAVKEVRYDSAMGDELSDLNRRTMREARAAGRLTHPNVVVVHDVIEEDDRPWIIMQLVPSRSLGQVIREDGPLSPERTVEIGLQILDALRAAHRQGVLHRDVKPENVLLTDDGRVVLTDFGIARLEADSTMTRTGLVGTPAFIAPERLRGEAAQRESDLWSLGATLYTAVEGKPPHDRGMAMATMHAVLNDDPAPPRRAGALGPVLLRMLAKEPADRPGYDELTRLLKRASRELSPPPSRPAEPASPRPATPEAAKPEVQNPRTPASRPGADKSSRGAAPYPPVSAPPVSSARREERPATPAERDKAAGAGRTPVPGEGAAAGQGGTGAESEAAGPGEITSPLPVVRDDGAQEQEDAPDQEKAGKTPAAMPETGVQAAPPARTTPSTGAPAKEKPGEEGGPAAADAQDGTTKIAPAVTAGAASGKEGREAPEGSAASGKTKDSGTSSGERKPSTTQSSASRSSAASGASATPKGAGGSTTGGSAASKGAAGSASSASSGSTGSETGSGGDSRTDRTGDRAGAARAETPRPLANGGSAGDERRAATADRTQDASGAAGIADAGSPIAGLRQAPAAVPPQGGAAWHEVSTTPVPPRSSNGMLKVALILIPALLVIAGVAGYLGLRAGEGDSGGDPTAGSDAAPAATGKGGEDPSTSASSSAAPSSAEPSASASDEATESPEPSPSPETSEPADVPKGWHKYKHSSGFSLALPKGWHVDGRGNGEVRFRGDSHTYLEVHHTTSPESDALKVWRRDVPGMSRNFPGYKLIEIREVKGYWKTAADWEFTFGDSRYRSRVIDRGFVTDKHNGYALLYKTQDKDWKKKKELFETIAATFKPAK
ncbi:protein kinase [Microbispora sp. NEAU-D428]|uniref:protein kinase domain-containing protein n=1 Tax=Microbispora sitophila TaxID=2771537 RepID=UPI0018661984|nr:serine/threonine-protein kinase [Microbispora sitophila]MBE3009396.1 protein kinase [Microbispora sitophila]